VNGEQAKFSLRIWLSSLLVAAPLAAGCCMADLFPSHKEAEFRKRVEHDNFPTAAEALHSSATGDTK